MTPAFRDLHLDRLGLEERLALAQELWDSVADELQRQPLTPAQRAELERRLADAEAHPERGIPWETVRAEARARWSR